MVYPTVYLTAYPRVDPEGGTAACPVSYPMGLLAPHLIRMLSALPTQDPREPAVRAEAQEEASDPTPPIVPTTLTPSQ